MKNYAVILASGKGERFNNDLPKQFVKIGNKTILELCVDVFEKSDFIDYIIVVITPEYKSMAVEILHSYKKIIKIVEGGKTRKESSYIGISQIKESEANVFIHDCARPFVSERILNDCAKALREHDAVGVAVPVVDTIIQVKDNFIKNIPERKSLMAIQTPQCFKLSLIKKAHELSRNDENFTDDCGLVLKYNLADIYLVDGDVKNFKITYPKDILVAQNT